MTNKEAAMTLVKWYPSKPIEMWTDDRRHASQHLTLSEEDGIYLTADVERIVGTVLRHLLHHNHEGLAVCAVCQEAQCLLALLEGRDE